MADKIGVGQANTFFDPRAKEFGKNFTMRIKKKKTKSRDRTASGLSGSSKGNRNSSLRSGPFARSKEMRASMSPGSSKMGAQNKMNKTLRDDFMKSMSKKEEPEMISEPVKIKEWRVRTK